MAPKIVIRDVFSTKSTKSSTSVPGARTSVPGARTWARLVSIIKPFTPHVVYCLVLQAMLLLGWRTSTSSTSVTYYSRSFLYFKMVQTLDLRRVLLSDPNTFGAGSQRPQPKHVRLWFGPNGPNQNTCVCGLVPTAPTKTSLESSITKVKLHFIFQIPGRGRLPRHAPRDYLIANRFSGCQQILLVLTRNDNHHHFEQTRRQKSKF